MPFAIRTLDKPGSKEIRDRFRADHYAFLRAHQARLIASGGLRDGAGQVIGGLILLDVENRAEAEAFVKADPFTASGLFDLVEVTEWFGVFLDGKPMVRPG